MDQIPTTSSSGSTVRESSAGPSSVPPPAPIQISDSNLIGKTLQSVSESAHCKDEEHGKFDEKHLSPLFASKEEMSEVGLLGSDQDDLCKHFKNSTSLVTGTGDTDFEHSKSGCSVTNWCYQLEGEAAAKGLTWTRAKIKNENNALVDACKNGDIDVVRKLLHEGRSVHETSEEGVSLLSIACSAGYYELAKLLLVMKAEVEDRGVKGDRTPLMEAASFGSVDIVKLLLEYGAIVNGLSFTANTPLMFACSGREHIVCKENKHTLPDGAESTGRVMVVKILIGHGADINHFNEFKESALTLACSKDQDHIDIVRVLLAAGADQGHETEERCTALMEASVKGHIGVARLLLESGAQINKTPDGLQSPLGLAASYGHVQLALLLIDSGANIEEVDIELYTPLMLAAQDGHKDMVTVLLSKGANINALSEENDATALTLACYGGFLDVAKLLIENGAMLELGSPTPLIVTAEEGHIEIVRYLLECGANVHAQTDTTLAYKDLHPDIADLLLQSGATFVSKH